jgi:hypothetical protein
MEFSNGGDTTTGDEPDDQEAAATLRIQALHGAWLESSCLQAGQVVLSINNCPTYDGDADEALSCLSIRLSRSCYCVSVKTCRPPDITKDSTDVSNKNTATRSSSSQLRRVAVAVGWSAMVGSGAVNHGYAATPPWACHGLWRHGGFGYGI